MPPIAMKTFLDPSASSQRLKKRENTKPWKTSRRDLAFRLFRDLGIRSARAKGEKHRLTFREIQGYKCLPGILPVTVDSESDCSGTTQ